MMCTCTHKGPMFRYKAQTASKIFYYKVNCHITTCIDCHVGSRYVARQLVITYTLLQYYHTLRKCFWLEQSTLAWSADRPSMHDCINLLDESSSHSASVLHTKLMLLVRQVLSQEGVLTAKWCVHHDNNVFQTIILHVFLLYHPAQA